MLGISKHKKEIPLKAFCTRTPLLSRFGLFSRRDLHLMSESTIICKSNQVAPLLYRTCLINRHPSYLWPFVHTIQFIRAQTYLEYVRTRGLYLTVSWFYCLNHNSLGSFTVHPLHCISMFVCRRQIGCVCNKWQEQYNLTEETKARPSGIIERTAKWPWFPLWHLVLCNDLSGRKTLNGSALKGDPFLMSGEKVRGGGIWEWVVRGTSQMEREKWGSFTC